MLGRCSFKMDAIFLDKLASDAVASRCQESSICNLKPAVLNQAEREASAFPFAEELSAEKLTTLRRRRHSNDLPVEVNRSSGRYFSGGIPPHQ
jgi:hypothetical protein